MDFGGQHILPAVRHMKDFERQLKSSVFDYLVILDSHVAQLENIIKMAKVNNKKILLHADLVQGLKNDEQAAEFICQKVKPEGIISTRSNVLTVAKKRGLLTIQRLFLLDSLALETSARQFEKVQPDFIEVLPGIMPQMIKELSGKLNTSIIAGGLIRSEKDVRLAIEAGATAVTTSLTELWK